MTRTEACEIRDLLFTIEDLETSPEMMKGSLVSDQFQMYCLFKGYY